MEKIKIEDIYQYHFLSETKLSPDGKHLAFTVTQAVEEDNQYQSNLWLMDTETYEYKELTSNGDESCCTWLDNETLLFPSKRGKKAEDKTTYYQLSIQGGEAKQAFSIPYKAGTAEPLCNGSYFFQSRNDCVPTQEETGKAKQGRDFEIFDEIPFWMNGSGIVNKKRRSGFLFDPSTGECAQFTSKYLDMVGSTVSEDRSRILYWGPEYTDKMSNRSGLYEYHIASGATVTLILQGELSIDFAEYWNGEILVEGSVLDRNTTQEPELYLVDTKTREFRLFACPDGSFGSAPGSDMGYGAGQTLKIIGDTLYTVRTNWGVTQILRMTKQDKALEEIGQLDCITSFDLSGDTLYCVAMNGCAPQELYTVSVSTGAVEKRTNFHQDFLENHEVSRPDHFIFQTKAGHELEGWVMKPIGYTEGTRYPGVLDMHGGPKGAFGGLYHHEMQCLAAQGNFVFYTNPRGSLGRGDEFSTLAGKLGEIDYEDFMEFTDEVLRRYPGIDPERLGVTGGSYGGFMTNWIIGHTNRFKAAVSQRSISNYFTKCLTTDIGYYHNLCQVGASPWENEEKMWKHSPLCYVNNAVTPTLFLHSDQDYRCWLSEPLQMFTNLRQRGIPSKVVLFHGENHGLSRSGKPKNRVTRLEELCSWFQAYLK